MEVRHAWLMCAAGAACVVAGLATLVGTPPAPPPVAERVASKGSHASDSHQGASVVQDAVAPISSDDTRALGSPPVVAPVEETHGSVTITGAVQCEIPLPAHRPLRLLEALERALPGGKQGLGDYSTALVRQRKASGGSVLIDIEDIASGRAGKNVQLFDGDLLVVIGPTPSPSNGFVYLTGRVKSPGRHAIIAGHTPFTLTKLLALYGGDGSDLADGPTVSVTRGDGAGGRLRFEVDFNALLEGEQSDFELKPDDLVIVPGRK